MKLIQTVYRSTLLMLILAFAVHASAETLRGLILTSPGVYHDYSYQSPAIAQAIADRINIQFDISLQELQRWKSTDFSAGYDVLVYNVCMADNRDADLIANLRRQSAQLNVPALVLHCTMHSFRETDLWWPFYGLKTTAHEALRPLPQDRAREHPVLAGIPEDWVVADDELYINLSFTATPVLTTMGEDGVPHVTTWLAVEGNAPVFGTTLGHSNETIEDPIFQQLLANAVLLVTGNLDNNGEPAAGLEPVSGRPAVLGTSKGPGVEYLGQEGKDCVYRQLARAVGPCYAGCFLHPFKWGDEANACRVSCQEKLPSTDEAIQACTATDWL